MEMNTAEEKETALKFLKLFESPDASAFAGMVTDDFEFEMMGKLPGISPIRGREAFTRAMPATLKAMFPKGLNIKFHTVIAEGPHVAIQCESDTVAANGKKYANRYHFYLRFEGDKIAQVCEYNDVNHVREVFFS